MCSRCSRLKLTCKIETNFKRVGKRSRNAEMEREIMDLRRQVAQQTSPISSVAPDSGSSQHQGAVYAQHPTTSNNNPWSGSEEAVASLLDLKSGLNDHNNYLRTQKSQTQPLKTIEDVHVPLDRVSELFNLFFTHYHPFLPFISPEKSLDFYFQECPLLFWAILSIGARRYTKDPGLLIALSGPVSRLVWSTLSDVPQSYQVVKALCLLCTWPFPTSSTSTDPTFMLCGMMIQLATQMGLHRPSHSQDFTKFRVELREGELKDRVRTWAVCNMVAQRVATGYGQPPSTLYDWTLASSSSLSDPNFSLPESIRNPLLIEQLSDKVTKTLYSNRRDPVGLTSDLERPNYVNLLSRDLEDLEDMLSSDSSPITGLYLRATALHLRLSTLFSPPNLPTYKVDLVRLYNATTSLLETCFNFHLPNSSSPTIDSGATINLPLACAPYYIYQMILAAGFVLLKLHNSLLQQQDLINPIYTHELFTKAIRAIRSLSVAKNDLPERLAEVLAQLWKSSQAKNGRTNENGQRNGEALDTTDSTLQLKVRCRMSMSLVYDSVWRWREDFQAKGGKRLEAFLNNPTDPSAVTDSGTSSASGIAPANQTIAKGLPSDPMLANSDPGLAGMSAMPLGVTNPLLDYDNDYSYEVFDPLQWTLDGNLPMPYDMAAMQDLNLMPGPQGLQSMQSMGNLDDGV